jgi:hypothetical protein
MFTFEIYWKNGAVLVMRYCCDVSGMHYLCGDVVEGCCHYDCC